MAESTVAANYHQHATLLITVTQQDSMPRSAIIPLHHWSLTDGRPSSGQVLLLKLEPNEMSCVRGTQALFKIELPKAQMSDEAGRHSYLSSLVSDIYDRLEKPLVSDESDLINRLLSRLRHDLAQSPSQEKVSVDTFVMPILGNSEELLWSGGPVPVWKWIKPESTYAQKEGFWEADLQHAINQGRIFAGDGIRILVRGVSEEKREALKTARMIILPEEQA